MLGKLRQPSVCSILAPLREYLRSWEAECQEAEGRVQGDEGLRFALVDCSGILPLLERPRLSLVPSLAMPKRCGRRCWPLFSTEFRTQQWRAVELMENLMKECIRMENKEMKKEAMAGSFKAAGIAAGGFPQTPEASRLCERPLLGPQIPLCRSRRPSRGPSRKAKAKAEGKSKPRPRQRPGRWHQAQRHRADVTKKAPFRRIPAAHST